MTTLLEVEDVKVRFGLGGGFLSSLGISAATEIEAVAGVSLKLEEGETYGIVGESGSGKTLTGKSLMRLLPKAARITGGKAMFNQGGKTVDLLALKDGQMRRMRGDKISMIFQDALSSLNPVFTIGWQLSEMYRVHEDMSKREARTRSIDLLQRVGISSPKQRVNQYPHEFSGGMRQRAMIAMAIALNPEIVIADEPTTALDVTVQAQIMELLADLQDDYGMAMVLITHDLGVVAEVADRVNVMYAGRIVEHGSTLEVFGRPSHPYTVGLMQSIPRADLKGVKLTPIVGSPPDLANLPGGCSFHPRCPFRHANCFDVEPTVVRVRGIERYAECHYTDEVWEEDVSV